VNTYTSGALPPDTADHENLCRPPDPACYLLFSGAGMMESQSLGPDRFLPRARRARAVRQRKLREPARPSARHSQSQAARPGSRRPPAERAGAVATARPQAVFVASARRATPAAALARHRSGGASRDRPGVVADGRGCREGVRPGLDGHFARRNCVGGGCTHRAPLAGAAARAAAFFTPREKPCRFRG
jgi:hypothetical protein